MSEQPSTARADHEPSPQPAVALAALMAGAGLIHLVMAPIHAQSSRLESGLFAVAAWAQILVAVALVLRPRRSIVIAGTVVNVVVLSAWIVSRTRGLPFGDHPNVAESIQTVDAVCAALEIAFVVGAAASLLNRAPVRAPLWASTAFAGAALGITAMVLVSPDVAQHDHDSVPSADPVAASTANINSQRCDRSVNPKAYWTDAETAGMDTVFGQGHLTSATGATAAAPSGDGHSHAATPAGVVPTLPAPDRSREADSQTESLLVQLSQGVGELNDAQLVEALSQVSNAEYETWLRQLHSLATKHSTDPTAPDDNGGHGGHIGPNSWTAITDGQTCAKLKAQLSLARSTALKYPTVADAEAGGWTAVTPYVAGIGAHYMNFSLVDGTFEVDKPEMLLYDGSGPDARIIGLSYYVMKSGSEEPRVGFAGGDDHFHRHVGLCVSGNLVIGDTQTTAEDCEARGGHKQSGEGGWMSHAWVVPGCESPWGVFSGANPLLDYRLSAGSGSDGGGCASSGSRGRYDLTPGEDPPKAATGETAESK